MAEPTDSGIYEIVNVSNGKRYVGSAKNFRVRWNGHRARLRKGKHHSRHLQATWSKHGEAVFVFRVLSLCEPADLVAQEQAAFDRLKPEYNVNPRAASSLGRKFTDETKAKIAAKAAGRKRPERTPAHRAALSAAFRGKQPSPEHMAALQEGRGPQGLHRRTARRDLGETERRLRQRLPQPSPTT